jgi:hypothetical protein
MIPSRSAYQSCTSTGLLLGTDSTTAAAAQQLASLHPAVGDEDMRKPAEGRIRPPSIAWYPLHAWFGVSINTVRAVALPISPWHKAA